MNHIFHFLITGLGGVRRIVQEKGISLGLSRKYLAPISEYQDLVAFLKKKSQKREIVIINGIASLFKELYNMTQGIFDQELVEKYSNSLIEELEGKGYSFLVNIFYSGMWLYKDEIKIDNDLSLRKINDMDFQSETIEDFNKQFNIFKVIPLTVLEFKYCSKS